jgi:tetratricopeptide (TPR) repeat protein
MDMYSIGKTIEKIMEVGVEKEGLDEITSALKTILKTRKLESKSLKSSGTGMANNLEGLKRSQMNNIISKCKSEAVYQVIALLLDQYLLEDCEAWLSEKLGRSKVGDSEYNNLIWLQAKFYEKRGDYEKAINYYEQVLQIRLGIKNCDETRIAEVYNDLGNAYFLAQNLARAQDNATKALTIAKSKKDNTQQRGSYTTSGLIQFALNNYEKAIECFNLALEVSNDEIS